MVGWPPIRAFRVNSTMNNSKNKDDCPKNPRADEKSAADSNMEKKISVSGSRFVKVNMDRMAIGRKVDLASHCSYETLALALQEMFDDSDSPSELYFILFMSFFLTLNLFSLLFQFQVVRRI